MMEYCKVLLSLSVSGAVLIALLLLAAPVYRKRMGKAAAYYLWIIVLLRLLIPVSFETALVNRAFGLAEEAVTLFSGTGQTASETGQMANAVTQTKITTDGEMDKSKSAQVPSDEDTAADGTMSQMPQETPDTRAMPAGGVLLILWFTVFVLRFLGKIIQYGRYSGSMRAGAEPVADPAMRSALATAKAERRIRGKVRLCVNENAPSPMLLGLFRPMILLPSLTMSEGEAEDIFRHELVHHKRLDLLYKWLVQLTVCIHWFNPLVYKMAAEILKQCELSCDEAVLKNKDLEDRIAYGDMLLQRIKAGNPQSRGAMLSLSENAEQVKERLGAIMQDQKRKWGGAVAGVVAVMVLSVALGLGAYATKSYAGEKEAQGITYYNYSMRTYFVGEYLITFGCNLPEKAMSEYDTLREAVLPDGESVSLYFNSSTNQYADDERVIQEIAAGADLLRKDRELEGKTAERIGIHEIEGPYQGTPKQLAAQFYKENKIAGFSAVAGRLDTAEQERYLKLFYEQDDIAYFAVTIEQAENDLVKQYAELAYKEDDYGVFSVSAEFLSKADIKRLAEQCYQDDETGFFSLLAGYMDEAERAAWIARAKEDGREEYSYLFAEEES